MNSTPTSPRTREHADDKGRLHSFDAVLPTCVSPLAAAYLRTHRDAILAVWLATARKQAAAVGAPTNTNFLQNSLPDLLRKLADALEDRQWSYRQCRNEEFAREHGKQRHQDANYPVDVMLDEYAMLRLAITDRLQQDPSWSPGVAARVHAFIDATACAATHEYFSRESDDNAEELAIRQHEAARHTTRVEEKLENTQKQRDASRDNVTALLEEKKLRERVIELLSHDLRSPLSAILVNVQRLENKPADADLARRVVPRVLSATKRIDRMIQDMLDASRLRAGHRLPVVQEDCDLAQLAAEAREDFAAAAGARIKLRTPETAPGLWDSGAIRRVIDNLVGNAIKYGSRDTDVTIEVRDEPHTVRLAVHNFGSYLTKGEIASLFNAYTRTKQAETGDQRGWGLGLTLVRGVIEAHQGDFGADSDADAGTTFWFSLPKAGLRD